MPTTETLVQSPTIGAIENADLLWVWDVTASALNKVTRGNLVGGTITGGGTIALNGATFTVPSSGGTAIVSAGVSGGQTLIGGTAANDDLILEGTSNATRATSYVVIQPNGGNVGIGTTSPQAPLHVSGQSGEGVVAIGTNAGGNQYQYISFGGDAASDSAWQLGKANQSGNIAPSEGFYIFDWKSSTSRLVISNTTGNVGIGTTSPDTRLDIDAGAIEFAEMTAPAAGAANTGRLFCRDFGGKTQLCVRFNSGAIQVIATEP